MCERCEQRPYNCASVPTHVMYNMHTAHLATCLIVCRTGAWEPTPLALARGVLHHTDDANGHGQIHTTTQHGMDIITARPPLPIHSSSPVFPWTQVCMHDDQTDRQTITMLQWNDTNKTHGTRPYTLPLPSCVCGVYIRVCACADTTGSRPERRAMQ